MIYLAPLQGFTDFVYRKVYNQLFLGVDAFFVPYITLKNNVVLSKYKKEVLPEHNTQQRVVPQVLAKDGTELLSMSEILCEFGYSELNLNLGCPYPMVTNRGKGSGLLPHPERVDKILNEFFKTANMKLSVKLRSGLELHEELDKIIPVLNKYPLKEVILHPRIAKQLYKGEIISEAYQHATENLSHDLVFNGDIFSLDTYKERCQQFPTTSNWMLGRGILMNPFLPMEMKALDIAQNERFEKLKEFHELMLESYLSIMDNEGNALNKMLQFWFYYSYNFPNQKKALKAIKKAKNIFKYKQVVKQILDSY